jgi:hypothetical protein
MRVDRILDSMPEGTQNAQLIDQTVLLELAREKLAIMRLAYRQRVFEFHSLTQQSKNFSSLRETILANFPQILTMYDVCPEECSTTYHCYAVHRLFRRNNGFFVTPKRKLPQCT